MCICICIYGVKRKGKKKTSRSLSAPNKYQGLKAGVMRVKPIGDSRHALLTGCIQITPSLERAGGGRETEILCTTFSRI